MQEVFERISNIIESLSVDPILMKIPRHGAAKSEIAAEEIRLAHKLSPEHKLFLQAWNGMVLDSIRLFGCGNTLPGIDRLSAVQSDLEGWSDIFKENKIDLPLFIGSDVCGFLYIEDVDGKFYQLDHDGGDINKIADNFGALLNRLIDDWFA